MPSLRLRFACALTRAQPLALLLLLLLVLGPVAAGAQSTPHQISADTLAFPEGIDVDPRTGTFYVTSLRHRTVLCGTLEGSWSPCLQLHDGPRPAAIFGVAVDTARQLLWLTAAGLPRMEGYTSADTARAELLRVGLADGRIERRWRLGSGRGMPGELALTPAGEVLVSDGILGVLYRLRPDAETLAVVQSPLLRSPQGIAVSADGRVAWVADWSRGVLRWELATDALTPLALPTDSSLRGIDGLRRHGTQLIGVQNGTAPARIVALTLDAPGTAVIAATTLDAPVFEGEPTVGTILEARFVYVSSSQWPFFSEQGVRTGTRALPPVVLRVLPLDAR